MQRNDLWLNVKGNYIFFKGINYSLAENVTPQCIRTEYVREIPIGHN